MFFVFLRRTCKSPLFCFRYSSAHKAAAHGEIHGLRLLLCMKKTVLQSRTVEAVLNQYYCISPGAFKAFRRHNSCFPYELTHLRSRVFPALASRPLHFFWVVDCSGSIYGEKIGTVNHAIQSTIPEMVDAAKDNPNAQLLVRTLKFSTGATWVTPDPVNMEAACPEGTYEPKTRGSVH